MILLNYNYYIILYTYAMPFLVFEQFTCVGKLIRKHRLITAC